MQRGRRDHGAALWQTRFKNFFDARETVRDVSSRDAARVEGTHGELSARLTDSLCGHRTDRLAEIDDSVFSDERYPLSRTRAGRRRFEELRALLTSKASDDSLLGDLFSASALTRARAYVGRVRNLEVSGNQLQALVQGSDAAPYRVTVRIERREERLGGAANVARNAASE